MLDTAHFGTGTGVYRFTAIRIQRVLCVGVSNGNPDRLRIRVRGRAEAVGRISLLESRENDSPLHNLMPVLVAVDALEDQPTENTVE